MKTTRIAASVVAFSLLGAACGGASEPAASAQAPSSAPSPQAPEPSATDQTSDTGVTIRNFAFAPKKLTISVGDTVMWTNDDDILHTVTSGIGQEQGVPGVTKDKNAKPDGVFDQEVEFEDTFDFTFDTAGTFKYFCAIHPGMVGTIHVE